MTTKVTIINTDSAVRVTAFSGGNAYRVEEFPGGFGALEFFIPTHTSILIEEIKQVPKNLTQNGGLV